MLGASACPTERDQRLASRADVRLVLQQVFRKSSFETCQVLDRPFPFGT